MKWTREDVYDLQETLEEFKARVYVRHLIKRYGKNIVMLSEKGLRKLIKGEKKH